MISNLLGLASALCLCIAVGGLAGVLWAVLLLGVLLMWMAYVLHSQPQEPTKDAVEAALRKANERADLERKAAVSQALAEKEDRARLEEDLR